jgi:hypothetical protein
LFLFLRFQGTTVYYDQCQVFVIRCSFSFPSLLLLLVRLFAVHPKPSCALLFSRSIVNISDFSLPSHESCLGSPMQLRFSWVPLHCLHWFFPLLFRRRLQASMGPPSLHPRLLVSDSSFVCLFVFVVLRLFVCSVSYCFFFFFFFFKFFFIPFIFLY